MSYAKHPTCINSFLICKFALCIYHLMDFLNLKSKSGVLQATGRYVILNYTFDRKKISKVEYSLFR